MANTQQYLVEYVVNANVSAAQQSLAALTAQMEQLQAQSVAPMRALGTSLDRLIKAQKNFGTRMGQAFDMTKPISQMTAFQNALLSTFKNAHVAMQGLFGNDIRMISAGLDGLATKGFKSERALTGMAKGASMSAKETASQFKQLQNVTKAEQAELNKLANMYQRLGMAKRGSGAKSKWSAAALKTFNEDEQKYLDKISKRWASSNPDTVLGHIQDAIKKRTASLGAAKKAEEDFLAKYGSKDKGAGVAAASTMATAPIMMSAKEMNEKVRATRDMVKSFRKIIDDNKGKPKTIKYSVIVDDSEAVGKLSSLKTKFEELQRLANINVRVKGGTAANSFRKSIGQINDSVQSLKSTLDTAVTGTAAKVAKAKKAPRSSSRVTLVPDKAGFQKSMSKLTGIKAVVDLILNANAIAKLKERVSKIKGLVANVMLKPDIVKLKESVAKIKGLKATVTLTPNIAELKSKLRGIKGLTAPITAAAPGTAGTTTASGSKAGAGATTNQPARRGGHPQGQREMQGTRRQMMRASTYPLVGNTSFGVQTPAFVGMAKGMVGMMGIGAAFGLIGDAMRQAVDYQNTMTSVKAILESNKKLTGYTPSNFAQMSRNVRQVGMDTKFTAPEVAGAARFMAMAGLGVREINNSIRPIADVALIGDNELEMTADKLTNIQTAFGIGKDARAMRKLADNLTTTFTRFNTDMMMTAEAMQYAAPVASAAGLGIEDTLAMIGIMGNAGIQASMAGTTLRMALQNIINPNKKQKAMWDKLGISRFNSDGSVRNMIDILGDLSTKADDKTLIQLVSKMFRVTSMAGVTQIIRNLDKVRSTRDDMLLGRDTGISSRLSAEKQNTVAGLWAQVTSAFTEDNVQMFERFQSALKEMLVDVRDYLRGPEAADNLNHIMELVKTMGWAFGKVAEFWMGLYNTFPGVMKAMMVIQLAMAQFGLLLNPVVGLYRTMRNASIGLGIAGAAGASGVGTAAATGVSAATAARFAAIHGRTISPMGVAFSRSFSAARAAGALSIAGAGGSLVSGLATVLGSIFSPIGITLASIAGMVYLIEKSTRETEKSEAKFNKKIEESRGHLANARAVASDTISEEMFNRGLATGSAVRLGVITGQYTGGYRKATAWRSNPQFRHTKGFANIFDTDYMHRKPGPFINELYNGYVKPVTGMSMSEYVKTYKRQSSLSGNRGNWGANMNNARIMAAASAVRLMGINSSFYRSGEARILNLFRNAASIQDKDKRIAAFAKAREDANNYINGIYPTGNETQISKMTDINAIGNMRASELANTLEYRSAIVDNLSKMLDDKNNPQMSLYLAIEELDGLASNEVQKRVEILSRAVSSMQISLPDVNGKIKDITIMAQNGAMNYESFLIQLRAFNIKVADTVGTYMESMMGLVYQSLGSDPLSKFAGGVSAGSVALEKMGIRPGSKLGGEQLKRWKALAAGYADQHGLGQDWVSSGKWKAINNMAKILEWAYPDKSKKGTTGVTNHGGANANGGKGGNRTANPYIPDTDAYKNHYQRSSARPTQIIFNIDNLVNFDKNEFLSADEKQIADQIMPRVVHAVTQAFATAQMQAGALVNTSGADMG